MKFGFRTPSLTRRIAARTSWKRYVRHSMGLKMPKGMGMITSPKKALYNKFYRKTTFGIEDLARSGKTRHIQSSHCSFSIWPVVIFLVLAVVFFPLAIIFLIYKIYKGYKKRRSESLTTESEEINSGHN